MSQKISAELLSLLDSHGIEYKLDLPIAEKSSFKIGGRVALSLFPRTSEQLIEAVRLLLKESIKFEVIGNASNILFAFDFYSGAFIFTSLLSSLTVSESKIVCGAGVSLSHLSNVAAQNSLSGLEFAFGIPALVGGAVYMNAGAYDSQMSDIVEYTVAYDIKNDVIREIYDNGFGYRTSRYEKDHNLICLGASLLLLPADQAEIKAKMAQNIASRREKQPLEYPSAGSYFKRPDGYFAAKLIQSVLCTALAGIMMIIFKII